MNYFSKLQHDLENIYVTENDYEGNFIDMNLSADLLIIYRTINL